MVRSVYEIRTFEALVDQLRCKGIWVLGAQEFRNPDEDLVTDFAERRTEHYAALRKPLDPRAFITELQERDAPRARRPWTTRCPGCRGWRSPRGPATRAPSGSRRWTRCPSRPTSAS